MEKKKYNAPQMTFPEMEDADIVTTSPGESSVGGGGIPLPDDLW